MSGALEVDFIEIGKQLRLTLHRMDSQLQKLVLAKSDNPKYLSLCCNSRCSIVNIDGCIFRTRWKNRGKLMVCNGSPNAWPAQVITETSVSANSRLLMGFKDASSLRVERKISALIYDC